MDLTTKGVKPMGQEEICAVFARNLNKLMAQENLKQSDLVLKLNVSKAQVSDWCAGKNIPRSNYLAAIVDLFGCQLSDLMSEKLLTMIHNLSPENRARIVAIIEALAGLE